MTPSREKERPGRPLVLLGTQGVVLAMILGLAFGWLWAFRPHGAYQGTIQVTFASPNSQRARDPFVRATNPLTSASQQSLIDLAAITVRSVTGLHTPPRAVSADVTLLDSGVYDGSAVIQPNLGGQWTYAFGEAGMQVQATGPSEAAVTTKVNYLVTAIKDSVASREDAKHVVTSQRVKILESSNPAPVKYVGGSRKRALAGMAALSVLSLAAMTQILRRHERAALG